MLSAESLAGALGLDLVQPNFWLGSCPACGSKRRFIVRQERNGTTRWRCFSCGDEAATKELIRRGLIGAENMVATPSQAAPAAPQDAPEATPWPTLDPAALHGLAGRVVETIAPHSEADPVGLLLHFLVSFGNLVHRNAHFNVGGIKHFTNLFLLCVGTTGTGRKGTAWHEVRQLLEHVDPHWLDHCVASGLSSGEGLMYHIRDPIYGKIKGKKKAANSEETDEIIDLGVSDKRLLCVEGEFASVLKVLERDGNSLSAILRLAFDGVRLRSLTRNNSLTVTDPLVSVIGHVTKEELLRYMTSTEMANGFANRFLFAAVKRSKLLPEPEQIDERDLELLGEEIRKAAVFARGCQEVRRDDEAREAWSQVYGPLTSGRTGMLAAILNRAEVIVMRLALIYAMLDCSEQIKLPHLEAALAVWQYAEDSARWIFGSRSGDEVADQILAMLRQSPGGATRTDIYNLFGRNVPSARIAASLTSLLENGTITSVIERPDGKGRPAERFFITRRPDED
jgi:hypothetical protein